MRKSSQKYIPIDQITVTAYNLVKKQEVYCMNNQATYDAWKSLFSFYNLYNNPRLYVTVVDHYPKVLEFAKNSIYAYQN